MPSRLVKSLPAVSFSGTSESCGRLYGRANAEAILAFLLMETPPDKERLDYAHRCHQLLEDWEKPIAQFVRGMAGGSGRTVEEITLLLLHEEIVHTRDVIPPDREHCTALGATGKGTPEGAPIIGMNWDWNTSLYTWSSLLRLRCNGIPATLTYSFPGLWAGAGINESGLAMAWTGGGYFPTIRPLVGIPTYALIAGILTRSSCREAIALIESTPIAGCFIFFLSDSEGGLWVVEGGAGKTVNTQCLDTIGRANHYETPAMSSLARQHLPPDNDQYTTCGRGRRVRQLLQENSGRIDGKCVETILRDHQATSAGHGICQHARLDCATITIDSFYMRPQKRELWLARGLPCRHQYECHTV